jgi:hypothetical protein
MFKNLHRNEKARNLMYTTYSSSEFFNFAHIMYEIIMHFLRTILIQCQKLAKGLVGMHYLTQYVLFKSQKILGLVMGNLNTF